MAPMLMLAGLGWILAAAAMAGLWVWQRRIKNAAVADAGWTAVVAGLAVLDAAMTNGMPGRRLAIASMIGAWGARLSVYLFHDRVFGRAGDGHRQDADEHERGDRAGAGLFWLFQARAAAAVFFSLPALFSVVNPAPDFSALEYAGAALWLIGFAGESTADRQLLHFTMTPENQGRVCQAGLWRYSRHPNYFFEWLIWVACALFAAASPWGWLTFACPAAMLYLLLQVSGMPITEARALRTYGAEYRAYQQTTSAFVPWPKKRPADVA